MMIKNKIISKLILPLGDFINQSQFCKILKQYQIYDNMDHPTIQLIAENKLQYILDFATRHSKYYKESLSHYSDEVSIGDFPILHKADLNTRIDDIISNSKKELISISTSGSTGERSTIFFSPAELSVPRAIQTNWWMWSGYKLGNSILQTGVNTKRSPEKALKDIIFATRYIAAFKHDEASIMKELRHLQAYPRDHFFGFASSLFLFAKVAAENNINNIRFKSISSFGEKLLPEFRSLIEQVFCTKVYDTYGCAEGLMIAGECEEGNYHVTSPHVFLEYVDDQGKEVGVGEIGHLLVTGLDNFSTPLIRYELGDLAVKPDLNKSCTCGRPYPLIGDIVGRKTELLKTPAGKFITVQTVTGIMKRVNAIKRFRFIQKSHQDFVLEYVPNSSDKEVDEIDISKRFNEAMSENLNIYFKACQSIEKSPSGKLQIIKNDVKKCSYL